MTQSKNIFFILFLFIAVNNYGQAIRFSHVLGSDGYDDGYSAKQTTDKGYIIGGSTSSFGAGATDMYLLKTDPYGNPVRQNTFGGINIDIGKCVRQTSDGGYILLGYTNSYGAGGYDVYLVKTDSLMDTLWTKTYGGTGWDFGSCIEPTLNDGGYIICGSTYSYGHGDQDYYVLRIYSNGDTAWTRTFGGAKEDVANSVIQTSDGGFLVTGTTKSMGDTLGDVYTVKLDIYGDTMWTNKWGGIGHHDYGNDILHSRNGGYLVAGESQSFGTNDFDGFIIKIDMQGAAALMWRTYLPYDDYFQSITEDGLGRIVVSGVGFSPASEGNATIYILNNDWSYFNGTDFGGPRYDIGFSVEPTNDYGFIISGSSVSFNNYLDDVYLIKTDSMGIGGSAEAVVATNIQSFSTINNELEIFPNPASDYLSINSDKINESTTIEIFDIIGNELKNEKINLQIHNSLNISDLANGIYLLKIVSSTNSSTFKLIVQH